MVRHLRGLGLWGFPRASAWQLRRRATDAFGRHIRSRDVADSSAVLERRALECQKVPESGILVLLVHWKARTVVIGTAIST